MSGSDNRKTCSNQYSSYQQKSMVCLQRQGRRLSYALTETLSEQRQGGAETLCIQSAATVRTTLGVKEKVKEKKEMSESRESDEDRFVEACREGKPEDVKRLLETGVDVNCQVRIINTSSLRLPEYMLMFVEKTGRCWPEAISDEESNGSVGAVTDNDRDQG